MFECLSRGSLRPHRILALAAGATVASLASLSPAGTLYWGGGTADISGTSVDTLSATATNMAGVWNTTTLNWNSSSSATTGYQAWADGNTPHFKMTSSTGTLNVNVQLANDVSLSGLSGETLGTGLNYHFLFYSTDANDRTLTLGANSVITHRTNTGANTLNLRRNGAVAGRGGVILAGTNGFTFNGLTLAGAPSAVSTVSLEAPGTISGDAAINSGILRIASLQNIQNFRVKTANSTLVGSTSNLGNVFNDNANVILSGGGQLWMQSSGNAVAINETLGKLSAEGSAWLNTDVRQSQTASVQSTLNLANGISRGDNGKGILVGYNGTEGDGGLGTTAGLKVTFGAGQGPGNNVFLPWGLNQGKGRNAVTNTDVGTGASARFMATNGSGELGVADSTAASTDLSTWSGTSTDLHIDALPASGLTNTLTSNVAMRSLAIGTNTSGSSTLSLAGNQITADAIGFATPTSANLALGTNDANRGTITSTGSELYVIHQRSNTSQASTLTVNSVIAGGMDVIFGGPTSQIVINSNNTYTGKTFINGGKVTLNTTGGLATTSELNIANDALFISNGTARTWGNSVAQKLSGGGTFQSNSLNVTIASLGTISPGDTGANDTLTFNVGTAKLILGAGSTIRIDAGATSDSIAFSGLTDNLNNTGAWVLDIVTGVGYANTPITVFANTTSAGIAPSTVLLNGTTLTPSQYTWTDAGDFYTISVPEPGTAGLAIGAMAMFGLVRRRKA